MLYLPDHFEETRPERIRELLARFPLATLVTRGGESISANHIPLLLEPDSGAHGVLIGHVARANDLWRPGNHEGESLAIFQSGDAYVSPNWYASKAASHEVVPTWNYATVHVYGTLTIHDDEKWLRGAVGKLTRAMESAQPQPWKMADAPRAYIDTMLANIVGIELTITRILAKTKASQNRTDQDAESAARGLEASGDPRNAAMAAIIRNVRR
ncbi:MAG TPA: FMN-binding negative transcriptional regulator, partial [Thermomicrobiales bacterium]|nr:FMN-binding negative transcriptional regulator [Thermomicrobiales bacterium]